MQGKVAREVRFGNGEVQSAVRVRRVNSLHTSVEAQNKVVEVKDGDSLWSIAKENMSAKEDYAGFTDIYQYVHEIKKCNNMKSDQVNAGCYLMIPYYDIK